MDSMLDRPDQEVILVVDDQPDNLMLMSELLMGQYQVRVAGSGAKALRLAASEPRPDLVLLDIMMPEMDGYEVCRQLKADPLTAEIPVIFLTGMVSTADEQRGLDLGAVDYITKPISPPVTLARIRAHLKLKANADFLRDKSEYLELEVRRRSRELQAAQDATLEAMATLCDLRDNPHSRHLLRIEQYMRLLADALARREGEAGGLDLEQIELLARSAQLHDIGKVAVPDRVLLNPGQLSPEDQLLMQSHTRIGHDALAAAERRLGSPAEFLRYAKEIAYGHHERWDGSGYPRGLRGEQIPLSARLLALIDCYDELTSRHPYHATLAPDEARQQILAASGSHFDPQVVEAFAEVADGFAAIAIRYADDAQALGSEIERMADALGESIEMTTTPP
ncbi:two-component system response regulator [Pseudomonas citronellolis]|uniref:Two-component system response regulator n=2 Tax=Pseudomonas citronellolis TaxID=53408 RepID=A0A1A9KI50_9PSED|nr:MULTISPECIES: two-component system response regulator [Pseudomonas]ANI17208.1 two-component system response regulator [Pseudomonas citronellolis]MBB1605479.1 two-component system response regulator [Pseudomonas sp. UMC76]MBB1641424.1 two-component system response regulator [Pseudomonas sp. UME83]NTX89461.1 two-component system response regulator [Pseudomonas sp. UMA643]NTY19232.1 two-component system response regulator [Pseudomonas sp. UMC3103]